MTLTAAARIPIATRGPNLAPLKIAIIGRGFSGLMTAIALLKRLDTSFELAIFDPAPKIDGIDCVGRSTILNSRVRDLSVNPQDSADFAKWLKSAAETEKPQFPDDRELDQDFVGGKAFGAYSYQRFSQALSARTDVSARVSSEVVVQAEKDIVGGVLLTVGNGDRSHFDAVFLATGYGVRDAADVESLVQPVGEAVVIGSGIRAIDNVLRLVANDQVRHVTLISTSRFLPQAHARSAIGSVLSNEPLPKTLSGVFRFLRRAAKIAEEEGTGWQGIMNGFRSRAGRLWDGMTSEERARFKRHVKGVYDSHRNRLPPEDYRRLQQGIDSGFVTVRKAKIENVANNGLLLSTREGLEVLKADYVKDCRFHPVETTSRLWLSMFKSGLAQRDELELGVQVDRTGRVISQTPELIFAIGPVGLGSLPDIDLVPEIVKQAHAAANTLRDHLTASKSDVKSFAP